MLAGTSGVVYRPYRNELDLPEIMRLVGSELSEPYVIYTYRYFLTSWPHLAFLAFPSVATDSIRADQAIGVIVCKQDIHKSNLNRGYIAMLSVEPTWRKRGIARGLVQRSVDMMIENGAQEIVLETEYDNVAALAFYAAMGFMREKRLFRFYMNGKDAFRLVLPVERDEDEESTQSGSTSPHMAPSSTRASSVSRNVSQSSISATSRPAVPRPHSDPLPLG